MSTPSSILNAMVEAFKERLGKTVDEVRVHEGAVGLDPKNTISGGDPLVLVACLGAEMRPEGMHIADGVWVAFVLTRTGDKTEDGLLSRSVLAGNLAFQIAATVDDNPWRTLMWQPPDGTRIENHHSEKLGRESGWAAWSVAWRQAFEITREDLVEIHRLASIHYTFVMGGNATPDALATIEFPEPT